MSLFYLSEEEPLAKEMIIRKERPMGSEKAKLRRYEDNLNVCGYGVIILGAWDIMKVIMQLLMELKDTFNFEMSKDDQAVAALVIAVIVAGFLLVFFLIFEVHLFIGLNASRAAKGLPHKKGYLAAAIILLMLTIAGMASYIDEIKDVENIDTTIASIIVDLTTIYILATVVSSTSKIKKLKAAQIQE